MSDGGLAVLDGTHLLNAGLRLPLPDGVVTGSQLVQLCESEASAHLFGLSLPEAVKSAVIRRLNGGDGDDFLSKEFGDEESKKGMVKEYLLVLADELKDDPLVISILDGDALRVFMDDEDDFAMLAENLFTDLDVDDRGKLSKSDIQKALVHMGVGMGVPPFSQSKDLLDNILKKHGAEGEEQLGQSQFAHLLQTIIQDLADALTEKNVIAIQNIKVINGSKLKKILANEKLLESVTERMHRDWVATVTGAGNKLKFQAILESKGPGLGLPSSESNEATGADNKLKFQAILESKGPELGLPSSESNEAAVLLYDQIFTDVGEEMFSGDFSRDKFQEAVKVVFKKFADQLDGNPIFIELES